MVNKSLNRCIEVHKFKLGIRGKQYSLIPEVRVRHVLLEKPELNRRQRLFNAGRNGIWLGFFDSTGDETGNGGQAEDRHASDREPLLTGLGSNLQAEDGISAKRKKIVMDADAGNAKDFFPDGRHDAFRWAARCDIGFDFWGGQFVMRRQG